MPCDRPQADNGLANSQSHMCQDSCGHAQTDNESVRAPERGPRVEHSLRRGGCPRLVHGTGEQCSVVCIRSMVVKGAPRPLGGRLRRAPVMIAIVVFALLSNMGRRSIVVIDRHDHIALNANHDAIDLTDRVVWPDPLQEYPCATVSSARSPGSVVHLTVLDYIGEAIFTDTSLIHPQEGVIRFP